MLLLLRRFYDCRWASWTCCAAAAAKSAKLAPATSLVSAFFCVCVIYSQHICAAFGLYFSLRQQQRLNCNRRLGGVPSYGEVMGGPMWCATLDPFGGCAHVQQRVVIIVIILFIVLDNNPLGMFCFTQRAVSLRARLCPRRMFPSSSLLNPLLLHFVH